MTFGTKVEEYRKRYGMNKKTLAERIGIRSEHLRRVTKGECPPSERIINRIIEVLQLSPGEAADLQEEAKQRVLYGKDNQPFVGKIYKVL